MSAPHGVILRGQGTEVVSTGRSCGRVVFSLFSAAGAVVVRTAATSSLHPVQQHSVSVGMFVDLSIAEPPTPLENVSRIRSLRGAAEWGIRTPVWKPDGFAA